MPEMDGVALARAIREEPAGAAVPLVLFTSLGRREARAESEGFAAYLHKPIKPSQLFDALVSVLADQPVHVRERSVTRTELDADLARRHPLRILLAEDNVVNQKVALRLLGQMGYRADVAANGLEAIEAVERQTYDVVLMDVQMPELDGFEASREINRRWPGERHPRIVAMTANALQGDRELCAAAGMDDYVAKPIRVEELVAASSAAAASGGGHARRGGGRRRRRELAAETATPPHRFARGIGRGAAALGGPEGAAAPAVIDRPTFERLTATMGGAFVVELIDTFGEDARELVGTLQTSPGRDRHRRLSPRGPFPEVHQRDVSARGALATRARELETMARAGSLRRGRTPGSSSSPSAYEMVAHRWRSSDVTSPRNSQAGDLLVVDDNRVNRLLLGRALEQLGAHGHLRRERARGPGGAAAAPGRPGPAGHRDARDGRLPGPGGPDIRPAPP